MAKMPQIVNFIWVSGNTEFTVRGYVNQIEHGNQDSDGEVTLRMTGKVERRQIHSTPHFTGNPKHTSQCICNCSRCKGTQNGVVNSCICEECDCL